MISEPKPVNKTISNKVRERVSNLFFYPKSSIWVIVLIAIFFIRPENAFSQLRPSNADSVLITQKTQFPLKLEREELISESSFKWSRSDHSFSVLFNFQTNTVSVPEINTWFASHPDDSLFLHFRYFPFTVQKEYKRYTIGKTNALGGEISTAQAVTTTKVLPNLWDDSRLRKSGSFVRGITVGSNRDLTLNSGFRMELEGNLTDDVEISAVLTDENIPIQPEGNTQTLQELDKVFIQLKHKSYSLTLGDYNLNESEMTFSNYNRKLQGLQVTGKYANTSGLFAFANAKGKFNSNQFNGTDGNQGPYRLRGKYNEKFIIILAGTERVYLNGILLSRGETNDYIIDYASGELTFTPKVLMSTASRVTVDFEYSDRLYARDFYAGNASVTLPGGLGELRINAVREADNKNAPLDLELSDLDKELIANAGNDPLKAFKSGVDSVGFNSETGQAAGNYIRVDSLTSTEPVTFYRYAPGNPKALYRVSFTEVKPGTGHYTRKTFGFYEYVGPGGNYDPIIYLPLPSLTQAVNIKSKLFLSPNLSLVQEFAASDRDENQFSSLDENKRKDIAFSNRLNYKLNLVKINGSEIGTFSSTVFQRYVGRRFAFIDRFESVEYNRNWAYVEPETGVERQLEWNAGWKYVLPVSFNAGVGLLNQGSQFQSKKVFADFTETIPDWVHSSYSILQTQGDNKRTDQKTEWNQQTASLSYPNMWVTPSLKWLHENKSTTKTSADSLLTSSYLADEGELILSGSYELIKTSVGGKIRTESEPDSGRFYRSSTAYTQTLNFSLSEWKSFGSDLAVTNYFKNYSELFRKKGNANSEATLIKWTTTFSPLNRSIESETDYQVNTQKTSKQDRIFIKVQKGLGNYVWNDRNSNGIQEINEFELTRFDDGEYVLRTFPSENLEPVVDLRASWRIRLKPSKSEAFSFLPGWIQNYWSTETVLNLEEKTRTTRLSDVYFLKIGSFFNDSTTIAGTQQWIQDLFFNEQSRDFSLRLRSDERKSMVQFSLDTEVRHFSEKSVRINWKALTNIYTKTDAGFILTQYDSKLNYRPDYEIQSLFIGPDVSYRTGYTWEIGLKSNLDSRKQKGAEGLKALIWSEIARYSYSFTSKGRFRAELEYTGTKVTGTSASIPYELTNGNPDGKLISWKLYFDYQISSFISSFISYDGRIINNAPAIHTLRAEVSAYF
ncbi:MAG: hypothetical protein LCH54_14125 [Bacteroidetes bacterium]|nr:hypothetical protein [Bacteroidota bacterium]